MTQNNYPFRITLEGENETLSFEYLETRERDLGSKHIYDTEIASGEIGEISSLKDWSSFIKDGSLTYTAEVETENIELFLEYTPEDNTAKLLLEEDGENEERYLEYKNDGQEVGVLTETTSPAS